MEACNQAPNAFECDLHINSGDQSAGAVQYTVCISAEG